MGTACYPYSKFDCGRCSVKIARAIFPVLAGIIMLSGSYDYGIRTVVVYREIGCSHFIAEGPNARYYIIEWRDGYDPGLGDIMLGDLKSGYADVYYPLSDQRGSVYVDYVYEKRGDAIRKYYEYCGRY